MFIEVYTKGSIDIERLIDIVIEYDEDYMDYAYSCHNKYKLWDDYEKMISELKYKQQTQMIAWYQMIAIFEVLKFDNLMKERLYGVVRAIKKWRKITDYQYLIPDNLAQRIREYVWDDRKSWYWRE